MENTNLTVGVIGLGLCACIAFGIKSCGEYQTKHLDMMKDAASKGCSYIDSQGSSGVLLCFPGKQVEPSPAPAR